MSTSLNNNTEATEYKFPCIPPSKEPTRLILDESFDHSVNNSLSAIIYGLPSYGFISYDPSTCYWYIKLPKEWQQATDKIVNSIEKTYNCSSWYKESQELGACWSDLVSVANPTHTHINRYKSPTIDSVTPPSVVGLHISLGVWSITEVNLPQTLIENRKVEFSIGNIISFRSIRPTPQNIPGQFTNKQNLRYYPTRWLFVEVTFNNFQFKTKYRPHISIGCIAVLLNVDHVARFQNVYKKQNNNINIDTKYIKGSNKNNINNTISITTLPMCILQLMFIVYDNYKHYILQILFICVIIFFLCVFNVF